MARAKSRLAQKRRAQSASGSLAIFLSISAVAFLIAGLLIWHAGGANAASGNGNPSNPQGRYFSCGQAGQAPCAPANPDWISLTSTLPGDVAQKIAGSAMFKAIENRHGQLALDVPMVVHPFGVQPGVGSDYFQDDHWVVAARSTTGQECGIFDFVYDRIHQRIRFATYDVLTSQDPRYGHAFPFISAATAQAQVAQQRHASIMAGAAPTLIFFPLAAGWIGPEAPHHWTGSGTSPVDPLWLIPGADGHAYFVGGNLHTYTVGDLPIAQG